MIITLWKVRIHVFLLPEVVFRLENCFMLIFTVEGELSFNLIVLIKYSIAFPSIHSKQ